MARGRPGEHAEHRPGHGTGKRRGHFEGDLGGAQAGVKDPVPAVATQCQTAAISWLRSAPEPASTRWISATGCLAGGVPGMSASVSGLRPSAMPCHRPRAIFVNAGSVKTQNRSSVMESAIRSATAPGAHPHIDGSTPVRQERLTDRRPGRNLAQATTACLVASMGASESWDQPGNTGGVDDMTLAWRGQQRQGRPVSINRPLTLTPVLAAVVGSVVGALRRDLDRTRC